MTEAQGPARPRLSLSHASGAVRLTAGLAVLIAGLLGDHLGVTTGPLTWLGALVLLGTGGLEVGRANHERDKQQAAPSPYELPEVQQALRVVQVAERHGTHVIQLAVEKVLRAHALQADQKDSEGGRHARTDE